ncbi:aldehyde dehydrogenase family protein [Novipirellula sp. SH528]|uniref:aldehyde dehydrogenase family protein n=1 Tax=Novipirellula sp. SH528 TaxID=3454466 RepID=UPI003F9F1D9A
MLDVRQQHNNGDCAITQLNSVTSIKTALANDSDFGLGGSIFTQDIERGKRIASLIDTGMVFVNHPTWTAAFLPFGGIKKSGYGRELSGLGIQEFVNKKLVRVTPIDAPEFGSV